LCLSDSLTGTLPGDIWVLSHEATVEFNADSNNNFQGFNATYTAENLTELSSGY